MRKTILTFTLLSIAFANSAQASNAASKEEVLGVGSGALIGAAAGGPFGLILGAAFGALIGDTLHVKNESIDELSSDIRQSGEDLARLQAELSSVRQSNDQLGSEVETLRLVANPELTELMQEGIAMDLLFRTDDTELGDTVKARLQTLANTLATMQDVSIRLDGFADQRGDSEYNQLLSQRRVDSVREQLLAAGIPEQRIRSAAHGEVRSNDATADSFAMERKVSMTLSLDEPQSLAANP